MCDGVINKLENENNGSMLSRNRVAIENNDLIITYNNVILSENITNGMEVNIGSKIGTFKFPGGNSLGPRLFVSITYKGTYLDPILIMSNS